MEKNGVFSRVRSRWRSIFSKKANPVKLRDCNRLTFERILSDPAEQIGTILAQATVEPITLPNGGGIALIQETTVYEDEPVLQLEEKSTNRPTIRRFRRLSSGDLNVIRRMTEEIDFDLKNVIYDGNEITGETDEENGTDRACFKPGPNYPTDQQMLFLKQCLKKVDSRPPNMYYLTNGWTIENFEALFKYMIRSGEDSVRDTVLSIEFRNCVVSLEYLHQFIEEYAAFKGAAVQTDYVYATIHSLKSSNDRKLRGAIEPFVEVESRVRKARISYASTFIINSPHTPNVTVVVRFCCTKPCIMEKGKKSVQISVQLDHVTGHPSMSMSDAMKIDGIACECLEVPADEEPVLAPRQSLPITTIVTDRQMLIDDEEGSIQFSYNNDGAVQGAVESASQEKTDEQVENDQTDYTNDTSLGCDSREYTEMFPTLLELFEKVGVKDIDLDAPEPTKPSKTALKKAALFGVKDEDTQSISSSSSTHAYSTSSDFSDTSSSDSEGDDANSVGHVDANDNDDGDADN
uniref:Uncharacterized protein n=1 Tax=Caenorhabditis japonica TaxID=281687 RepID=A0A8R1DKQ8_CAEJA